MLLVRSFPWTEMNLMRCTLSLLIIGLAVSVVQSKEPIGKPNIVVILADDLGYGDPPCYNPESKIPTPYLDKLASQGMRFTDGHTTSSVCTPTRYGLMTGRYNWRSRLQSGVLGGLSPRLIEPDRMTVASLLKEHGYHTACFGKWHLGMDWHVLPGKQVSPLSIEPRAQVFNVDYTKPIKNGPNSVGFDYYYGISASLDMVPYTFIENDRLTQLPTEDRDFAMVLGSDRRTRKGPTAPDFDAADVLPVLCDKSVEYIASRAADARNGKPFFLYLPLASPHTPILPTMKWQGKTMLNPYGDFVAQTDEAVGALMNVVDREKLTDNTLFIFISDNGCSPQADYPELAAKGHNPSGPLRGHKADIYEGGHRVPFIARWPGQIPANTVSSNTTCATDLLATCAEILGYELPDNAGEDSISMMPSFREEAEAPRRHLVSHSVNGSFAIRKGQVKLCLCPGSGGWSAPRPGRDDTSSGPLVQLFDLDQDLGETTNLAEDRKELVEELTKLMEQFVADGRSTPGKPQKNTVEVDIWRAAKAAHRPVQKKGKGPN